jgi:hypothetical protein
MINEMLDFGTWRNVQWASRKTAFCLRCDYSILSPKTDVLALRTHVAHIIGPV